MTAMTGGCQCGQVRFRVELPLGDASVCHCRMCQKAFGNFFAPLVNTRPGSVRWLKAPPSHFQSSNHAKRGFCPSCGTPLTFEAPDGVALSIGAFDDPAAIPPRTQWGVEAKLPYADGLHALPAARTEDDGNAAYLADLVSYQHPDRD